MAAIFPPVIRGGGEWGAPISTNATGGVITVYGAGFYEVDGPAASHDVNTISGLAEGDEIVIKIANNSRVIVLKHGTDNIYIGSDITLNNVNDRFRGIYDASGNVVEASSRP